MYQAFCAAVIGVGFIGPVHVENVRRLGVRVRGVLGSSEAKSIAAANKMDLEIGYAGLDALLRDDEVNVVHVTSPNLYHHEQVLALLRAGKHVLCEKPLAMDSQQTRELVQAAADSGLKTAVQYNIRFYPLNIEARARTARYARLFGISGGYVQDWLMYETDYNWRVLAARSGAANALGDIGTHYLDLVQWITGRNIESVCADVRTIHKTRMRPRGEVDAFAGLQAAGGDWEEVAVDTDDFASVLLRFAGDVPGHMWTNQVTAGRKNRIWYEVVGDSGSLSWDGEDPNLLRIGHRNEPNQALIKNPALQAPEAAYFTGYPVGHAEGFGDTHKMCFKAFYDDLAGLNPPIQAPTLADGHRELCLVEAILESSRRRAWVDVAE